MGRVWTCWHGHSELQKAKKNKMKFKFSTLFSSHSWLVRLCLFRIDDKRRCCYTVNVSKVICFLTQTTIQLKDQLQHRTLKPVKLTSSIKGAAYNILPCICCLNLNIQPIYVLMNLYTKSTMTALVFLYSK